MKSILQIRQLHKRFGTIHAVKSLSLDIHKGNVYGLLGPNGSGKSTTLGMILNVVNITAGSYQWFEGQLTTQQALKKVGAIIERPNFYPYMTAAENLALVCKIKEVSEIKIDEKLAVVGLLDRRNSPFRTFSLGMKQRLAIASALLNDPEILILDEPTNGLDPQGIHQIRDLIKKIAASGTTILLASHLLDEVEKVCTHVVILQKGEMRYAGPVQDMQASEFYQLQAPDMTLLQHEVEHHPLYQSTRIENNFLLLYTKQPIIPAELNAFLCSKQVFLSHLSTRRTSLEEQFLALTAQQL